LRGDGRVRQLIADHLAQLAAAAPPRRRAAAPPRRRAAAPLVAATRDRAL